MFFIDPDGMKPCPTGDCPPEIYDGPETAVGENVYNQLDEVVVGAADGVYVGGSKKSFFSDGDMSYGLKAEGKIVAKKGGFKGTVEGNIESLKIGSEGSMENGRVKGNLSATVLKGSVAGSAKFGEAEVNVNAKGSLFSAEANTDLGAIRNENGDLTGFVSSADVGAYAAKGEVSSSFSLFGYGISLTKGGSVGSAHAGFKLKTDLSQDNFEVSGYAHGGLGVGFKVGVTITKKKQKIYNRK